MFKKRRGISEMIAVVLLLIIVSVAGVALYRISLNSMSAQYQDFSDQISEQTEATKERFEVVNIQIITNQQIIAYIYSYTPDNALDTTISRIYVNSENMEWFSPLGGDLERNQIVPFTISSTDTVFNLDSLKILVVSQRGVTYAYP